jgi:hypothetical protein
MGRGGLNRRLSGKGDGEVRGRGILRKEESEGGF